MGKMQIVYMNPDVLMPYSNNAKKHPDAQVEQIAKSIKEFGFQQPIVVDADNVVVIGHGRLLAAKKLELDAVPVVRADDLTEAQIKALRLADNKTNESEWDFKALEDELASFDIELDMSAFGFENMRGQIDALDLDESIKENKQGDQNIVCHCPKCGFEFEVKK